MGFETQVQAPDILTRLRRETRDLHKAVERQSLIACPVSDNLTPHDYVACLALLDQFHAALEPATEVRLGQVAGLDLPFRRKTEALRRKTEALRRDLSHFGCDLGEPLPPFTFATAAAAWGALHVIEGATLGGMVITRQLGRHDWLCQPAGRYHFAGYGPLTGQMWAQFRTGLLQLRRVPTYALIAQSAPRAIPFCVLTRFWDRSQSLSRR